VIVVWCGFEIAKKANQTPEAFRNMRLCFALLPTVFLAPALILLSRYPLSHKRMEEIRAELEARRGRV
jgi:GPH family glycoside/pentoside/hexuronide:cation symporter